MRLYILLFIETLLFLNSSELTFNQTHLKSHSTSSTDNPTHDSRQLNNEYNEVLSVSHRNLRQFSQGSEPFQSFGKTSRSDSPNSGIGNNKQSNITAPVAVTLELPGSQHFSDIPATNKNIPFPKNEDRIIFPDDNINLKNDNNFTKEEIACFTINKVFFNNSCEDLLVVGMPSCNNGEWLILDLKAAQKTPPQIKPKCEKKICSSEQFYWYNTKRCYDHSVLENPNYETFCPPGNTITDGYFGYGTCVCKPAYGLYTNETCYQLYSQGPCLKDHLFVEINNKTECIKNPCKNASHILYEKDKLCYELGTRGPCNPNVTFQVSKETRKPECIDNIALLNAVGPPKFCPGDGSKQCQTKISVENNQPYVTRIVSSANKLKG